MIERTFVAIKPDGVKRALAGEIIRRLENAGLKIVGMKMFWVDKEFSQKHYAEHVDKPFYKGLEEYIISGPVIAMVLEGVNAVEAVRKIVGPTEPGKAPPGTIRGDYAHHTFSYTDAAGKSTMNLIHASGNAKDAEKELSLWFSAQELFRYKLNHEHHVM